MLMSGKEVNNLIIGGHRFVIGDLIGKHVKATGYYKLASSVDLDTGFPNPYSASDSQTNPSSVMTVVAQIRNSEGRFTIYIEYPGKGSEASNGGWISDRSVTIIENNGGVNSPSYLLIIYKLDDVREVTPSC